MNAVQRVEAQAAAAQEAQVAAWRRWQNDEARQNEWEAAVDRQRAAEAAVEAARDRAEAWADRREAWNEQQRDRQADWWVAAWANARAA